MYTFICSLNEPENANMLSLINLELVQYVTSPSCGNTGTAVFLYIVLCCLFLSLLLD